MRFPSFINNPILGAESDFLIGWKIPTEKIGRQAVSAQGLTAVW
jgi:hypothetical protein